MTPLSADLQSKLDAYLLGRLPHGEQTRIETLLFEDDDVLEAVRDAEDDLIDRYLAGELTPADREAFERTFAMSASRQERIAFARALPRALAAGSGAPVHSAEPPAVVELARGRRRAPPATRRLVLAAGAAVAAALVLGIVWRTGIVQRSERVVLPGDRGGSPPSPPPTSPSAPVASLASPVPEPEPTVTMPSDVTTVATLILPRVELRRSAGNLPRWRVPAGARSIRLQPVVEAPIPGARYAVTLRRVEGPVVWRGTARADVTLGRLTVTVPSRLVGPGDYVLRLAAPGASPDDSAEYPFRIAARD